MAFITNITSILVVFVAFAALAFSVYSFYRQQDRAERHAIANVKPLLSIKSLIYDDHKAIKLMNYGLGPASIKQAIFSKDGKSEARIVDLFCLPIKKRERFQNLSSNQAIPAQAEIVLVEQTLGHLLDHSYSKTDGLNLLSQWQHQKSGIDIYIEYQDIFGNTIPPLRDKLN